MPYVSGFDHDIFISYALVDDEKRPGVEMGWVTAFVKTLEISLSSAIGRLGRLEPWWDRTNLKENQPLDKQIQQALEKTACLVVILSPGFLESPWCPKELEAFRTAIAKQARNDTRIFVVDMGSVTEQQRRQEFANYKPFDFWKVDDRKHRRPIGFPEPNSKDHPEFYDAVQDLADKLKEEFDLINSAGPPIEPQGPTVYVAEVSDDLTAARKQLVTFLESHQFRVVCGGRKAVDINDWRSAASKELAEAKCFVQLLGLYPGREIDGADGGLVKLQYELAASMGAKVLQWRDPGLLSKPFEDPTHLEFVKTAIAMECPLEEFKAEVKRIASPPPVTPVERVPVNDGIDMPPMVFIHAGVEDIDQAQQLSSILSDLNCWVTTPLTGGEPDKIREDLEANLTECDGLIVFYGRITPDWVRAQFRSLPRILPKRQKLDPPRPLKALAICNGVPAEKPNLGVTIPGVQWIDLANEVSQKQISEWVGHLRNGGAK